MKWNLLIRSISHCAGIRSRLYCPFHDWNLESIADPFYKQMDVFSGEWHYGCSRVNVNASSMEPVSGHLPHGFWLDIATGIYFLRSQFWMAI